MKRILLSSLVIVLTGSSASLAADNLSAPAKKISAPAPAKSKGAPPVAPARPADESFKIPRVSETPSQHLSGQTSTTTARTSLMERGKNLSRHGLYKDALDFFNKAATANPKSPEPYNRRARCEWQLEQHKEALEDANYAIQLNPDYAEAFCTRAAIYNSQAKYQEAIADASMAQDLKPNLRDAYTLKATAYHNLGQHSEADAVIDKLKNLSQLEFAFDEWRPNIDYTEYLTYLQATVKAHWQAPPGNYGSVVPLFKVHRNGTVSDLRLNSSTGDANADNAAMSAVKQSEPFRQPPAGTPPDFDCYIVLDHVPQQPGEIQAAAQAAPAAAPAAPAKSSFNWGGTFNMGLNLMRTGLMFAR